MKADSNKGYPGRKMNNQIIVQIVVGLFAILVGAAFCLATVYNYIDHNTIAVKSLMFGLVDIIVGTVLLCKAYLVCNGGRQTP